MEDSVVKQTNVIDDDIDFNDNETEWKTLIEQILLGNVIPVICPGVLTDNGNLNQVLIDYFVKKCGVKSKPHSFSELVCNSDFEGFTLRNPDRIYEYVNKIFATKKFTPSSLLKKVLSIKYFPFVITTSFAPIVEQTMRELWGDELKVKVFSNNPGDIQDIQDETDLRKPTVYYMMGRVGGSAHRFVLTDTDMLDFCSTWVADTNMRPNNLVNVLRKSEGKDKYLLMLGNNYSDWLFRFIWFSIRRLNNGLSNSCYASHSEQKELKDFLERNHAFIHEEPEKVVDEIITRIKKKEEENELLKFNRVEMNTDIFISYSRSDSKIVELLYDELTKMGKRVWYDRNNISCGGKFMSEIYEGIDKTRYFVPIFSSNIEKEKNDKHVYRQEWHKAIEIQRSLGRTFIIPIVETGVDFYKSSIDLELKTHSAIEYSSELDIAKIAAQIIHEINK